MFWKFASVLGLASLVLSCEGKKKLERGARAPSSYGESSVYGERIDGSDSLGKGISDQTPDEFVANTLEDPTIPSDIETLENDDGLELMTPILLFED